MESKKGNVFEKLNLQEEKIDDISSKLEGININDLYALAKRTWDYGDFETAQKYYNHISLLNPIDWEAPLYASLCNYKGLHEYDYWLLMPKNTEKIFISTINYINKLSFVNEKKESEMSRCLEIIKKYMEGTKKFYFDDKDVFDDLDDNYVIIIEEHYLNVYKGIADISLKCINAFKYFLINNCFDVINKTQQITNMITNELFEEIKQYISDNDRLNYNVLIEKSKKDKKTFLKNLPYEEQLEIKLKGKLYFIYNDKILLKQKNIKKFICSIIMIISSSLCLIFSEILNIIALIPLLWGIYVIIYAFKNRKMIRINSLFCFDRRQFRLTSDNILIMEEKNSIAKILNYIMFFLSFGQMYPLFAFLFQEAQKNIFIILIYIISLASSVIIFSILIDEFYFNNEGKYILYYKNKKYYL